MPPFEKANAYSRNGLQGRPKGSRNKLCRAVLDDLLADWAENGPAAIRLMRIEKPNEYVKMMAAILPRELILEHGGMSNMDDDALDDLLAALHQRLLEAKMQQEPVLLVANDGATN